MGSNDFYFLIIPGLSILIDRTQKDIAYLNVNLFQGMEIQADYPQKV